MRKKLTYKTNYCKDCIWLTKDGLCPFARCIKGFDWIANKGKGPEVIQNGEKGD